MKSESNNCLNCGSQITHNPRNKFCSHSCSAAFTNKGKPKHGISPTIHPCPICKTPTTNKTYCSKKCFGRQRIAETLQKMELGCKVDSHSVRTALLATRQHSCENCNLSQWLNQPIPLDVHHLDGDANNNRSANLKLLCKNCHALTDNYGIKNLGNGRHFRRIRYSEGKSR